MTTTTEALEPKLNPCRCGRKALIERFYDGDDPQPLFMATCEVCPVKTYDQLSAEEAARIWNEFVSAPIAPVVDHRCLLCGHASVDVDGVCMMNVPTCSDDAHDWRRCGCKCKFRAAPASTVAPQQSDWLLDCPMCNAPRSFAIDSSDDAVGFCLAELRNWRIIDTTCSTDGCFQPKATFGDLCMVCLAKAVDAQ